MEINLNNNFGGSMSVMRETGSMSAEGTNRAAAEASGGIRQASNLTIGEKVTGLSSAEPKGEVPDVSLKRDDALGNFVNSVFNLPPPPMPSFDVA